MLDFAKKRNAYILITLIIMLGAYLRLSDFQDLLRFNIDQARDAEVVDSMLEKKDFPLVGPKAGGTPFLLGPAFYYMAYLSAIIFGNDPSGMAYFIPILSILSIPLFFFFMRLYFSNGISLYLSFIYAISFFIIKYSRFAWNPNAIPFFLFLFMFSILQIAGKSQKAHYWTIALGISLGIGVQLHTFLFIFMPLVTLICLAIIYFKEKKEFLKRFSIILAIGLILNVSFFTYDWKNNWENTSSFFHGAENKTEKNQSLTENLFLEGQFFRQGLGFILSGYEPHSEVIKMIMSFKARFFKDILATILSMMILTFGIIQSIRYYKKEKDGKKLDFFRLQFLIVVLSFFLFLPVAQELNVRFYMAIIFLPFTLLGVAVKFLEEKLKKPFFVATIAIFTIILIASNASSYKLAYNFNVAEGKSELYGGISLREARNISSYIASYSKKSNDESGVVYLFPFEYNRSLGYFIKKDGFNYIVLVDGTVSNDPAFLIGKSKNKERIIEDKERDGFKAVETKDMGRFAVFVFER